MAEGSSAINTVVADTLTQDECTNLKEVKEMMKSLLKYWMLGAVLGLVHVCLGITAIVDPCEFGSHAIGLSDYGTCFWLAGMVNAIITFKMCNSLSFKLPCLWLRLY